MSAYFNSAKSRWYFEFDKVINGERVRAVKTLPKGWNRAKAEAFSKVEIDRLYALATGTTEERVLIESAVALYVKHQCPTLKNGDGVIKELARIHWAYAGKYFDELAQVGRDYRERAFHEIKDAEGNKTLDFDRPLAPATIKNKLSYLRAACVYAQDEHGIGKDVKLSITMPTVNNERQVYADRREMLRIAKKCEDRTARAVVRIAFYSGMRIGEILIAGENAQKMAEKGFLLPDTKNGDPRIAPMHPRLRVLRKYFPLKWKKRWLQRLIRRAMNETGFEHLHLHDVRHSTASALINEGVDLYTVGKVLGHKDQRSTARYSHLATETLNAAVLKIR